MNNLGFCEVCGEPGERFTRSQPGFLCREHMLLGLSDPAAFEREMWERGRGESI